VVGQQVGAMVDGGAGRRVATAHTVHLVAGGGEQGRRLAADEAAGARDQDALHATSSRGTATTNFAPQSRASASWPSISPRKFQGRIRIRSGRWLRSTSSPT